MKDKIVQFCDTLLAAAGDDPIQKIVIIVAMPEEAQPILQKLNLTEHSRYSECTLYSHDESIYLAINTPALDGSPGIGTRKAALTTQRILNTLQPDLVISVGSMGGYEPSGIKLKDIVLVTQFTYHNRDIPIPRFEMFTQGHFPCINFNDSTLSNELDFKTGIIATADTFSTQLIEGIVGEDMEGAAIAETLYEHNQGELAKKCHFMALKGVSNYSAGHPDASRDFEQHFSETLSKLADATEKLITRVFGKQPSELNEFVLTSHEERRCLQHSTIG